MGQMREGFWVVSRNSSDCELERQWADTTEDAQKVLLTMISTSVIEDGDSFKVEAGESER